MQKKTRAGTAPVLPWRNHCESAPELFAPLAGTPQQRRSAERWEADAIARLACDFEATETRAAALRSICELRECTVRQAAMFFEVESDIVAAALSLLPAAPVRVPALQLPALVKAA